MTSSFNVGDLVWVRMGEGSLSEEPATVTEVATTSDGGGIKCKLSVSYFEKVFELHAVRAMATAGRGSRRRGNRAVTPSPPAVQREDVTGKRRRDAPKMVGKENMVEKEQQVVEKEPTRKKRKTEKKTEKKSAAAAPRKNASKTIDYDVLATTHKDNDDDTTTIFPPVFYSNVEYTKGIRVTQKSEEEISVPKKDYFKVRPAQDTFPYAPVLPQPHLWSHRRAANEAAKGGFPCNALRLLGTITRTVKSLKGPPKAKERPTAPFNTREQKRAKMTKAQAKKQVLKDCNQSNEEIADDADLEARIDQVRQQWDKHWSPVNMPQAWATGSGDILHEMVNDDSYVSVSSLLGWQYKRDKTAPVDLYNGLQTVPTDLESVLDALEELQHPYGLYETPLVMAYPLVTKLPSSNMNTKTHQYQVTIGVYAHRLLPEIMTEKHLKIVMTALDPGSYHVSEPLHLPPAPSEPTFASASTPKVVYDDDDDDEQGDVTLTQSTRVQDTISAFTIPGLLKLWENTGTDVTAWKSTLEERCRESLKLDLLLHQQHALCWMMQMEALGGFGINSILWEERKWLDGDTYYYSPALGQLRLDAPPTVHGGILSDEMGLGKTIDVLALICCTPCTEPTLIIVPPALVGQWCHEITKAAPQLKVTVYTTGTMLDADADICITTYNMMDRPTTARPLLQTTWDRVVLDEMQEVRSSTTQIAKSCDKLVAKNRWMLSGTPLFDGITDLRGELNFLSLEPYAAKSEDGFFEYSITNHWHERSTHALDTLKVLGLLLLRRSKTMTICESGLPVMGLKPLTVEFIPVSQTPYERALYCFLEYVVAKELDNNNQEKLSGRKLACLRLLRELCISPFLLCGGVGSQSEMVQLNHLLVNYNRRDLTRGSRGPTAQRTLSCREAIQYLSQAQANVQIGEDFVSELTLGAGGGMSKRNRATESMEVRLHECWSILQRARGIVARSQSERARARWHWALEKITTGQYNNGNGNTLWSARANTILETPSWHQRGWRPRPTFSQELLRAHPEFAWAHDVVRQVSNIPNEIDADEILDTLAECLGHSKFHLVGVTNQTATWSGVLQLSDEKDAKTLEAKGKSGLRVITDTELAVVGAFLEEKQTAFDTAKNQNEVFPTGASRKLAKDAEKELKAAKRGLLIEFCDNKEEGQKKNGTHHIQLLRCKRPQRASHPRTAETLFVNILGTIELAEIDLAANVPILQEQEKLLRNLERVGDVPDDVKQMSAFESLEAISMAEYEKTFCVICMGVLGSSDPATDDDKPGIVGLTGCGHLFCDTCIREYTGSVHSPKCPTCRKDIEGANQIMSVDPALSSEFVKAQAQKRSAAKVAIEKAATMLEDSNGQLDSATWLQLYLSIDLPLNVSSRGDSRLSAIPREVVSFCRAATGMEQVHNKANALPASSGLSSKTHALLRDLPKKQRSVVFTTALKGIKHLSKLFELHGIGHRALFSGQHPKEAEHAVQEWKESTVEEEDGDADEKKDADDVIAADDSENPLVLVVQAGAAASGLTLTAASKMFFMEPFARQEEEQQAFARCHRYGQMHAVHAKVYFTPVSVESRLLEWRKVAVRTDQANTKVVFADLLDEPSVAGNEEDDEEWSMDSREGEEEEDDDEEANQTAFLLGLQA